MKEKISFTEQIRIALSKPAWYKSLFQQSVGKHLCYFLILLTLITVIQYVIPVTAYLQSMGGLKSLVYDVIPSFSLDDGELTVEGTVDIEQNGVRLIMDTSVEEYTMEDAEAAANEMEDSMPVVYLVSRTNIVSNQMMVPVPLSSMGHFTFNNEDLYRIAPFCLTLIGIFMLVYNTVCYFVSGLFFALFGYLLNKSLKLELKFGQIYVIALYAKSVEVLLESILQVVGFSLLYYIGSIAGIFITCNYMTRGMSSMMASRAGDPENGPDGTHFSFRL